METLPEALCGGRIASFFEALCRALEVSRSRYYAREERPPGPRSLEDAELTHFAGLEKDIHADLDPLSVTDSVATSDLRDRVDAVLWCAWWLAKSLGSG